MFYEGDVCMSEYRCLVEFVLSCVGGCFCVLLCDTWVIPTG